MQGVISVFFLLAALIALQDRGQVGAKTVCKTNNVKTTNTDRDTTSAAPVNFNIKDYVNHDKEVADNTTAPSLLSLKGTANSVRSSSVPSKYINVTKNKSS
jgi:hypothetical protein